MSFRSRLLPVVTITGSSLVVGCGGGNYGGSCGYGSYGSSCGSPAVGGPGYFEGTLASSTGQTQTPVVAIIAENGDGRMSGTDGTYYRLTVGVTGNMLSGSFNGYSQGPLFPNGTVSTTGTVSGTVTPSGINGTFLFQGGVSEGLSLQIDSVSNFGSVLSTLAGTWSYTANGFSLTMTIAPDGTFLGSDSNNCTYTGAFGIIAASLDTYSENYVRTCNATAVTFTGLATYFPPANSATNAQIKMRVDNDAGEFLVAYLQ